MRVKQTVQFKQNRVDDCHRSSTPQKNNIAMLSEMSSAFIGDHLMALAIV